MKSPEHGADSRQALGIAGEAEAERKLTCQGLKVVARRFRTRWGELDLVAREGDLVVFVEVKARRGTAFGRPADAVTPSKQKRLARVAQAFLQRAGWGEHPCRFDVVEVAMAEDGVVVTHIPDAFRPSV